VNPSVIGQSVTFTATVTGSGGTPTGTVTFRDGATTIGTGTLSSGVATLATTTLAVGGHSITAEYSGNASFNASTSSALSQTINKGNTTTAVTSSVNPSNLGQSVTFTATVSVVSPAAGTRTGTVTFFDGATNIGASTLAGNVATLSTAALTAGIHSISALYGGDANFNTSTSPGLTQTVKTGTTTALVSNVNPSNVGQSVTFTATVTGAGGTPTGTITFRNSATTIGTGTLSGGVATFATSALAGGTHGITAAYSGDSLFNTSTSPTLTQTVNSTGGSYPIIHMQDTTVSFATLVSSSRPIVGEYVTTTSQLVGDKIDRITIQIQKVRSPVGVAQIGVFNSDLTVKMLFGTIQASTISTSLTNYSFQLASADPLYTIQSGDIIGIKFTGSTNPTGINLTVDRNSADPFDGTNSYRVRSESNWKTTLNDDMYMILEQTHG